MASRMRPQAGHLVDHRGFSLIELLVALSIGLFLLMGAIYVFQQTRTQYRAIESVARVQEAARYAMSVLENDLRLAGYWGRHNQSSSVTGQPDVLDLELCGSGDTFSPTTGNLATYIAGGPALDFGDACALNRRAETDALLIRRASVDPVPPETFADPDLVPSLQTGILYAQSNYVGTLIFEGNSIPVPYFSEFSDTHRLVTHGYYISDTSESDPNLPALRRLSLGTGPAVIDEEIIHGIEDLTVEFGLDTNGDGRVNEWTNDEAAVAADPSIAVRLTLAVRSETRENDVEPDGFRRIQLTKTIYLRNQRR